MADKGISSVASRLCAACGMCCNGVMFHTVILQVADSSQVLSKLGLRVKQRKEKRYINQPCVAYKDSQCSIYADRPTRCRLFECRQLQRVASSEITEAMALDKIEEALCKVRHLHELLEKAGAANEARPLSKRVEAVTTMELDAATDSETVTFRHELAQSFQELDHLLDCDFRVEPTPQLPTN